VIFEQIAAFFYCEKGKGKKLQRIMKKYRYRLMKDPLEAVQFLSLQKIAKFR
jgi:hypothetical protein